MIIAGHLARSPPSGRPRLALSDRPHRTLLVFPVCSPPVHPTVHEVRPSEVPHAEVSRLESHPRVPCTERATVPCRAPGYTAAHPDGIVRYTAHELRHVCASLLIASGASDIQVAHQMGIARSRQPREHLRSPV